MKNSLNYLLRITTVHFTIWMIIFIYGGFHWNQRSKNSMSPKVSDTKVSDESTRIQSECKYCIDYGQYETIISPEKVYDIVLLITSSHRKDAAERREILRSTWANNSFYLPALRVAHVFILGKLATVSFVIF